MGRTVGSPRTQPFDTPIERPNGRWQMKVHDETAPRGYRWVWLKREPRDPRPGRRTVSYRVTDAEHEALRARAAIYGCTVSALARDAALRVITGWNNPDSGDLA